MLECQVQETVDSLNRTKKAIITLGCSFVQGQGSMDQEIVDKYPFKLNKTNTMCFAGDSRCLEDVLKKYPRLAKTPSEENPVDFTKMEYDNAFTNVLCSKYLKNKYTPINFGMKGNGNKASIMNLFRFSEFDYSSLEDIIVMFFPTGIDRYDMAAPHVSEHFSHKTIWPHFGTGVTGVEGDLWKAYALAAWSEIHVIQEYYHAVEILRLWCKTYNAKLFIMPAFDNFYEKDGFMYRHIPKELPTEGITNQEQVLNHERSNDNSKRLRLLYEQHPWDKYIVIDGCKTISEIVETVETGAPPEKGFQYFQKYIKTGSPNKYWSKCSHPSQSGHTAIAMSLYEFLLKEKHLCL